MKFIENNSYRKDIDGLRAIAVISVILFHLGYLPNGYLGVDVFFVISGYLITGIIYNELLEGKFSILNFYKRRIRRILPLSSFICLICLVIGFFVMLPDDLENLAQSVVATNLVSNNILPIITTKNYWDVSNEFKPLMHTWSLGIEEQYYIFYPFLFLLFGNKKIHFILPTLFVFSILSIFLLFLPFEEYLKFYLLPFRFFELSLGGTVAILMHKKLLNTLLAPFSILGLILFISIDTSLMSNYISILIAVTLTCFILCTANSNMKSASIILENKLMVFIGKISFSLYMWHQVIFSFGRYFIFEYLSVGISLMLLLLIFFLSILTYFYIEQSFRDVKKITFYNVLFFVISTFFLTTSTSLYLYYRGGTIRDIPELGILQKNAKRNMHAIYNDRIYQFDSNFKTTNKIKILVIGNSFARDWCNVLLESKFKEEIELSYVYDSHKGDAMYDINKHLDFKNRVGQADYIFCSAVDSYYMSSLKVNKSKVWCIGTKNFGKNSGIFYNYLGTDYCSQRTQISDSFLKLNNNLKANWGSNYIDLIGLIIDKNNKVPVFTPDCKFISQDCTHFTEFGAKYFSILLESQLKVILVKN